MKVNVDSFRAKYGRGPAGAHPAYIEGDAAPPNWLFEVEMNKTVFEFKAPGASDYGLALRSMRDYASRMFVGQRILSVKLLAT